MAAALERFRCIASANRRIGAAMEDVTVRRPCIPPMSAHRRGQAREIHFQTLLVAKSTELAPAARVYLGFGDLRRYEPFEQGAAKRRPAQLLRAIDAQQMTRKTRICDIDPGRAI